MVHPVVSSKFLCDYPVPEDVIRAKQILKSGWERDARWLALFRQKLEACDALSLDIFDTALTRVVETPVDVFALMERGLTERHGSLFRGFAAKREQAEQHARDANFRSAGLREVRYADILKALKDGVPEYAPHLESIEALERAVERHVLMAVPEVLEAVTLARQAGKPVLFVSDMYWSAAILREWLSENGYAEDIPLLVSSETMSPKSDPAQWENVIAHLGKGVRILHVGDNPHADEAAPRGQGIATFAYTRARSRSRRGGLLEPAVLPFSLQSRLEALSTGRDPAATDAPALMAALGRSWGALVVGAYVRHIARRAPALGLKRLFFCARDGWLPHAAWKAAGYDEKTGIRTSYLHLSRRSVNLAAAALTSSRQHLGEEALETLVHSYLATPHTLEDILKRSDLMAIRPLAEAAASDFGSLKAVVRLDDWERLKSLFQRFAGHIFPVLAQYRDRAIAYFRQEGLHEGRVGLADLGWHGSIQASIGRLLRHDGHTPQLYGFYYGLWNRAQANRLHAGWMEGVFGTDFSPDSEQYVLRNVIEILEDLLSGAHGTTIGYRAEDGRMRPVLNDESGWSRRESQVALIEPFQQGVLTALGALAAEGGYGTLREEDVTREAALAAMGRLGLSPAPEERRAIGQLEHCSDFSHRVYRTLLEEPKAEAFKPNGFHNWAQEWPMASALILLERCPEARRAEIVAFLRQYFAAYDRRTVSQFQ